MRTLGRVDLSGSRADRRLHECIGIIRAVWVPRRVRELVCPQDRFQVRRCALKAYHRPCGAGQAGTSFDADSKSTAPVNFARHFQRGWKHFETVKIQWTIELEWHRRIREHL